jgi:hypothetical protein
MPESIVGRFSSDFRLQHPFCMLVSGTSGSGKTTLVRNFIEKDGIKGVIREIHFFLPQWEEQNLNLPPHQQVFIHEGLPTKEWISKTWTTKTTNKDTLFVIDDQWHEALRQNTCQMLGSWARSHLGISTIFVTQYYYQQGTSSQIMKFCPFFI